jgi:hypothetical protein
VHAALLIVALGGEAVSSGETGLNILELASIIAGWVGLAALWYFVFRDKSPRDTKRKTDSSENSENP